MTEPLTPPDCDLRDFPRMMIDITRLRQSAFDATPDDSAWRAGLNLWFSAWHSVPAGSLDDDEAALTKAAGLGRDVRSWRKVKSSALRGFTLCSDGRLYHETVCELALEAWIEKLVQRLSSGAGNAKRWGATFDPSCTEAAIDRAVGLLATLAPDSKGIQKARRRHSKPHSAGNPTGTEQPSRRDAVNVPPGSQGKGTGTLEKDEAIASVAEVGFERVVELAIASSAATVTPDPAWKRDAGFVALWAATPDAMRRRAKSPANAHPVYRKALSGTTPDAILAGMRGYLAKDPDVSRTGGPGLHIWLNNRTFETYAGATQVDIGADWPESRWAVAVRLWREDGSWDTRLGPIPGDPGCRAPATLLIMPTTAGSAA